MASIEKPGDNFRIMVSLGYDMEGKQIRKNTTFKPPSNVTEGKAEKLATAFAYEFEKKCMGMSNLNKNIRFSELSEWYYDQIAPHKLKEATLNVNLNLMKNYVLPYIGHLKLKDISTSKIDEMLNHLFKKGKVKRYYKMKYPSMFVEGSRRPLSRKTGVSMNTLRAASLGEEVVKDTAERIAAGFGKSLKAIFKEVIVAEEEQGMNANSVAKIRTATSAIFSTALKKDIISKNPVTNATSPREIMDEKEFLDAEECKRLIRHLDEIKNPNPRVGLYILIYTGVRSGELRALHWEDVDLEKGTMYIRYNLYRADREYKLSTPKTKSSERIVAYLRN